MMGKVKIVLYLITNNNIKIKKKLTETQKFNLIIYNN